MKPSVLLTKIAERTEDPLWLAKKSLIDGLHLSDFSKSVRNCHTPGVDSVVLYDGPDGMIRYYYAHAQRCQLHRLVGDNGHFTVAIHNHRYQIAKIPLIAPIINLTTDLSFADPFNRPHIILHEYVFSSALKGEGLSASYRGPVRASIPESNLLLPGDSVVMAPQDLHTIITPRSQDSAWIVIEGPPADITPLMYSPSTGLTLSQYGLYEPMSHDECVALTTRILDAM